MMNLKVNLSILLFSLFSFFCFSQNDFFENYQAVSSKGEMPSVFSQALVDESGIDYDYYSEVSDEKLMEYLQYNHYGLRSIMGSGKILYGDPMSEFVNKVASKLMQGQPDKYQHLQFFLLKTNYTNALCMEPGVIFITTGLLAQLENEAQLAYILAHEISHYIEKHFQRSYVEAGEDIHRSNISYEDLTHISKEHEFEADKGGVKIYHEAGYNFEDIVNVFSVLMYSYLPFDEVEIDSTFFGNETVYIPSSLFPEKANPILSFEEYDDRKSTHPNIKRRTEAIISEIDKLAGWKQNKHFFDESEFLFVRDIARFEFVRNDFLENNFIEALYGIYLLEKKYPNNEFLMNIKASTWIQMSDYYLNNRKTNVVRGEKNKEGNISRLYGFFSNLDSRDMGLLTVRMIEDIYNTNPSSPLYKEMREFAIHQLNKARGLDVKTLERLSFYEALVLNVEENMEKSDTLEVEDAEGELSKYDKIRNLQRQQSSSKTVRELVDENFAYFLLSDLLEGEKREEFLEIYNRKEEVVEETPSRSKRKKSKKEKFKAEGNVIFIGAFFQVTSGGQLDVGKSIEFEKLANEAIEEQMPKGRFDDFRLISGEMTTKEYNEYCQLVDYFNFVGEIRSEDMVRFYVDKERMESFLEKRNNPLLLLIDGESFKPRKGRNVVRGSVQFIDLKNNQVHSFSNYRVSMKVNKTSVGGLIYEAASKL